MTMTGQRRRRRSAHPSRIGLLITTVLVYLAATSSPTVSSAAAAAITLVDSKGSLTKALLPTPSSEKGIVALICSPGTPSLLFPSTSTVNVDEDGGVIRAPGASLEDSGSALARGVGAAAAGSVAGAVVLTGVTIADVEAGLDGTRHGRTLAELFASVLKSDYTKGNNNDGSTPVALTIAVQSEGNNDVLDSDDIKGCIEEIFDGVAAAVGVEDTLGDHFAVRSILVSSAKDVADIMTSAKSSALASASSSSTGLPTAFSEIYKRIALSATTDHADPTPVAEAILACNDAYSRASRTSRARIASWRHRVSRNLLVPKFGIHADALLTRTLDLFDRDTMAAAGLPRAGSQRLIIRKKLYDRTEGILRRLFDDQMTLLEKNTLRRFQSALLRKMDGDSSMLLPGGDPSKFFESNADALRSAAFAFDVGASSLEVPSLSLTKSKAVRDMNDKLNAALISFPDSPVAKIKSLAKVERVVNKKKQPTEGSVSVALDLIAMIRPDGFGNLQGFAGYQLGPHSVTVGVHNDADDPGVISQFGGVRPPFLRVQPKLKLDVEL